MTTARSWRVVTSLSRWQCSVIRDLLRSVSSDVGGAVCRNDSRDTVHAHDAVVLGIESSCDDTGVGVVSASGLVLGEALHSQLRVHLKTGGIVPIVAGGLHAQNLQRITQQALDRANISMKDVSAVAVTAGPGLAPCLQAGMEFSKELAQRERKPLVSVHHMEAHALTARLSSHVPFPYLVLLVSGGHCLLLVAEGVGSFQRLGYSTDDSPGEALDKIARMLRLHTHPDVSMLSGGAAIEVLATRGDPERFSLPHIMSRRLDCMFSFSGLKTAVKRIVADIESNSVADIDCPVSCCEDLATSVQAAVCRHLLTRTHRAVLFTHTKWPSITHLVVSGGVASNKYLRMQLELLCSQHGLQLVCPPPCYCTDNGVMIAWTAIEYLNAGRSPVALEDFSLVDFKPRWPLGEDISSSVTSANIKLQSATRRRL